MCYNTYTRARVCVCMFACIRRVRVRTADRNKILTTGIYYFEIPFHLFAFPWSQKHEFLRIIFAFRRFLISPLTLPSLHGLWTVYCVLRTSRMIFTVNLIVRWRVFYFSFFLCPSPRPSIPFYSLSILFCVQVDFKFVLQQFCHMNIQSKSKNMYILYDEVSYVKELKNDKLLHFILYNCL